MVKLLTNRDKPVQKPATALLPHCPLFFLLRNFCHKNFSQRIQEDRRGRRKQQIVKDEEDGKMEKVKVKA